MDAEASANLLSTSRGAFVVTQECISTPLIPLYLAAVFAGVSTWRLRAPALLAAFPLFVGLGVARLLVVALPAALIGSPLFLIHAFYQLFLAAVLVLLAAIWRHGAVPAAWRRALAGVAVGSAVAYLLVPLSARVLRLASAGSLLEDPQGAIALLPAFQAGFYVALFVGGVHVDSDRALSRSVWRRSGSSSSRSWRHSCSCVQGGFTPHVRDVRALAIAVPVLVVLAIVTYERPRR